MGEALIWSAPSVPVDAGHFAKIIALKAPAGIEVDDYHTELAVQNKRFLRWCDRRLGADKSNLKPEHGMSPWVWVRMVGNSRMIHATDDRQQCDQPESYTLKAMEEERVARGPMSRFIAKLFHPGNSRWSGQI